MVSGARLKPGDAAIRFARAQGGVPEASILTTNIRTSAINAALVNGMFGHADETDDFEPVTKAHPGCAVVPAALAMGERDKGSGTGSDSRGRARLRPVLSLAARARTRARARDASRRRRRQLHDGRRRGCGVDGAPGREGHALCAVVRRSTGVRRLELGARSSNTWRRRSTSPAWARATA